MFGNSMQCGCCDGGGGDGGITPIPNCVCTSGPTNLTMVSSDQTVNFATFQNSSLTWLPTSSTNFGVAVLTGGWYSTSLLTDPGVADFFYGIICLSNKFSLTRIYPTSPMGTPFRDGTLFSWFIGVPGNTCSPFQLHNGLPFPGGGPVSITVD